MKKITLIAAARPNFMKIAPLARELDKNSNFFEYQIVHTGQHYDHNMSASFFEQLNIPNPDVHLEVGSGSHAQHTASVMIKFEEYLLNYKPNLVVVVGDVNSTMACSITAKKLHIPVAHVESGLRSFDHKMPEEINRLVTDAISDILYTPSEDADKQLQKEGHNQNKIEFVGNIMIDTLLYQLQNLVVTSPLKDWVENRLGYALLTLHRPSNVDNKEIFSGILSALESIAKELTIIFPAHPRTRKMLDQFNYTDRFHFAHDYEIKANAINIIDPISYNEILLLNKNSKLVLTDSGGLQEETTALNIPCITIRENTERPITVTEGTNYLVGTKPENILDTFNTIILGNMKSGRIPKYWDGKTAERIVKHLIQYFNLDTTSVPEKEALVAN